MYRIARHALTISLSIATLAGLSACGSKNSATDTTVASPVETTASAPDTTVGDTVAETTVAGLSTSELVAQADAICTQVRTDMGAVPAPDSLATAGPSLQKMLDISVAGVASLKALPAADGDRETLGSLVSLLEAANEALKQATAAATAGDEATANSASDAYSAKVAAFAEAAKAAGFEACGQTGPTGAATETTAVASDGTAADTSAASGAPATDESGKFGLVDLGTALDPIAGFTYQPLDKAIQSELLSGFAADPNVVELVNAVGTSVVTNDTDRALLIFLRLNRPLVGQELQEFVSGVIGNGTEVEQGEVAGTRGWSYVDSSGSKAFVTVRNDTAILSLTDSTDVLATVIAGLFQANPTL